LQGTHLTKRDSGGKDFLYKKLTDSFPGILNLKQEIQRYLEFLELLEVKILVLQKLSSGGQPQQRSIRVDFSVENRKRGEKTIPISFNWVGFIIG